MEKNRLYTVNKWNKPAFMGDRENQNIFDGFLNSKLNSQQLGQLKAYNLSAIAPTMSPRLTTSSLGLGTLGNKGGLGSLSASNSTEFFGLGSNGGASKDGGLKGLFNKDAVNGALGAAGTGLATAGAGILGGLASNALSGGMTSEAGEIVGSIGSTVLGAAGTVIGGPIGGAIGSAVGNVLGGLTNRMFGSKLNQENINTVNSNINKITESGNAVGQAQTNEELMANAGNMDMGFDFSNSFIGSDGWFSSKARRKAEELRRKQEQARAFSRHALTTGAQNADANLDFDVMSNFAAFGGPLNFGGGALGLMQQNEYFNTIDRRTDAIAGKSNTNTAYTGGAKTFAGGGNLEAAFLDDFGKDPIGAAVRYNQGLEQLAAQREAAQVEAAREAEYADMQKRLLNLETENQGLQAMMTAMPTSNPLPNIPTSSPATSKAAPDRSTWGYIEDQLRRSGKFNDVQIKGIKYNLQRESSINPDVVGDGGAAFGLGQWHGSRKPKDMSLEGQTKHLIDTISSFDGKEHWISKKDYEGFLNARTPEEAHYYLAKGYERPRADIVAKVKRDSDMSLKKLNAFGGELGTNGTDFTNGLLYIDEGGSHESNPLDGVPMGVDAEGIPNLVEEGETVYNDYVFSDRMIVPSFMLQDLGLPKGKKDISFADASKKLAQESEKRPNDPISKAGLQASLSRLAEIQETERMRKQAKEYMELNGYACGGKMGRKYGGPGSQTNRLKPYKYDPIDTFKYWNKDTNSYDEGYRDFIQNKVNDDWINRVMAGNYGDMSRYKGANNFNPSVEQAQQLGLDRMNSDWHKAMAAAYDEYKAGVDPKTGQIKTEIPSMVDVAKGMGLDVTPQDTDLPKQELVLTAPKTSTPIVGEEDYEGLEDPKTYATWMRYAPAVGAGIMSLTDMLGLTNKPDYTMADKIEAYAQKAGTAPQVNYKPIGNYLRYNPMDIWYEQNRMDANARATDRAIMNNAAPIGTKMAGLLASGYNNQIANGQLYRNALEYNDAKRKDVADFNRRTNMFNSQMGLEADMANARYQQAASQMGLSGLAQAAALRDQIDARTGAAKSANLTNFLTSLGNIGRENFAMNQLNWDKSRNYSIDSRGRSGYKRKKKSGNR